MTWERLMTDLTRRQSLAALLGGAFGTLALGAGPADAAPRSFVAFGDSFTRSFRYGVPSWADQLHATGAARLLVNLAVSGATAEGWNSTKNLDGQVDLWTAKYRPKAIPDRTVIYFGYNDVKLTRPLTAAMKQYRAQVDRLISLGVTRGSRRLVLCQLHDWSRNPAATTDVRSRVRSWNKFLASLAAERSNVTTVNLFARFEDVFENRRAYGFSNVTTASKPLSATTHLYFDGNHFGRKGQAIIAKEIRPKLL
jgi:lysophospholipase L1-like esterase